MADTRYTPQGKKKKPKIVWQRFITFLLCVGMVIAFCTFGLKYMMTGRVVPVSYTHLTLPTILLV